MKAKKAFAKLVEYERTVNLLWGPASQADFGKKQVVMRERGAQQGAPGDANKAARLSFTVIFQIMRAL